MLRLSRNALSPWVATETLGSVLRRTSERVSPNTDALVFPHAQGCYSSCRISYPEYYREALRVCAGLRKMGIKRGDHIGVWATNVPEWVFLQFGAALLGAVLVTINPAYRLSELEYTLKRADIVALFFVDAFKTSNYNKIVQELLPSDSFKGHGVVMTHMFPKLRRVVSIPRERSGSPPYALPWENMLVTDRHVQDETRVSSLLPDDVVNVQYTSGTTGFPKAAMLSHSNILHNAYYVGLNQKITEGQRMCVPVPFYHCFGCVMGSLCAVVHGATLIVPNEAFDASKTLHVVAEERCDTLYGVPTMFVEMLANPSFSKFDYSSLRSGIMAGSPCPIDVMKRVVDLMHMKEITIAYGQTETSPVITQTTTCCPLDVRVGTVGRCLPGVQVRLLTKNGEEVTEDGVEGELCARGHGIFRGYYGDPTATANVMHGEWIRTGDLATKANGNYIISGRCKDLIIRGGENIAPLEVEQYLFQHPSIKQAAVFGVSSDNMGEEVCAWIQLNRGHRIDAEDVRQFCAGRISHFKIPRYIRIVDDFPTTVSGKIQKFKMRAEMEQILQSKS